MPDDARSWMRDGMRLHQQGQPALAVPFYRRVLDVLPADWETRYLLGTALLQTGQFAASIELLAPLAAERPDVPDVQNNLGVACKAAGHWEQAARAFEAALRAQPDYADAFFNLGQVMEDRTLWSDAEKCYRHTLHLRPGDLQTEYHLCTTLRQQQKWDEAETRYRTLAVRVPHDLDLLAHLAFVLVQSEQWDEAAALYRRVLEQRPEFAELHANLSYVLERQGNSAAAIAAARRAVELKPEYAEGHNNLGTALKSAGDLQAALQSFQRAAALKPEFALARFNRGTTHLLLGDWTAGWPDYECRGQVLEHPPHEFSQPRWQGEHFAGETLLVQAEQGLGDALQFVRYLPLVKARGGTVVFQCPRRLLRLLSRCAGFDHLVSPGDPLPRFDKHVPLLSLPGVLGTTIENAPRNVPYVFADPERIETWRIRLTERLAGIPSERRQRRIGICWQGNPRYRNDSRRSIPLEHFMKLAELPGVQLVSLQQGDGVDQLERLQTRGCVLRLDEDLDADGAFVDTAAILPHLDLVVTSDTAVAHLAGALGRPVWVALEAIPEWRWLLDRSDSPWYPTMRLFRQPSAGDWASVFAVIGKQLADKE